MKKIISVRSGTVEIFFRLVVRQTMSPQHVGAMKKLSSELKHQALFFDQIYIHNLDWILRQIRNGQLYQRHSSWLNEVELELEWLSSNEVIVNLEKSKNRGDIEDFNENMSLRQKHLEETDDLIRQAITQKNVGIDKLLSNMIESDALYIRELVSSYKKSDNFLLLPSLQFKNYLYEIPNSRKVYAVEVVVNNLPVPSPLTPWESIVDYRNDPTSEKNLLNLRRWVSKITSTNLSNSEIEEEFESLINDYQAHMDLHKMKTNTTSMQTLITLPFELLENLIKIRFSKIPEPLFVLRKHKISLMEAELNAPGRELAYVIKAKEEFADSDE